MALNYKELVYKPLPSSATSYPTFQDLYVKCDNPVVILEYLDERHPYLPILPATIETRLFARYLMHNLLHNQTQTIQEIMTFPALDRIAPNTHRPTCVDFCLAALVPHLYNNAWRGIRREYL